jgi:N-acetylglucosaminyl-diphospho-decaprenol L-rhamnosyltransferase
LSTRFGETQLDRLGTIRYDYRKALKNLNKESERHHGGYAMSTPRAVVLVLNYNGRALLEDCMPSIMAAARNATTPCVVMVVDNDSNDNSRQWLAEAYPEVACLHEPNRGLASYNEVLKRIDAPYAILLNNDVKLDLDSIDPLIQELERNSDALFAAPFCLGFDNETYEGMRTRVRDRFGLIQGLCRVPDHQQNMHRSDLTASAGPVLAVDRLKFLSLGGYDPIYFPGRIEDLDLGFRGWLRGWRGMYVPKSKAWHKGFGSFEPELGMKTCDRLALRNTLLFTWRNIRGARLARHFLWLGPRLVHSILFRKGELLKAAREALQILHRRPATIEKPVRCSLPALDYTQRQEDFFRRFSW